MAEMQNEGKERERTNIPCPGNQDQQGLAAPTNSFTEYHYPANLSFREKSAIAKVLERILDESNYNLQYRYALDRCRREGLEPEVAATAAAERYPGKSLNSEWLSGTLRETCGKSGSTSRKANAWFRTNLGAKWFRENLERHGVKFVYGQVDGRFHFWTEGVMERVLKEVPLCDSCSRHHVRGQCPKIKFCGVCLTKVMETHECRDLLKK